MVKKISEYFSVALSLNYIIITHRDSKGIIYFTTAPGIELDPKLMESFRNSIQYKHIDLPEIEGEIEIATFEGKYLISRAGREIWVSLILNQKPTFPTREGLNWFTIIFEKQYEGEIRDLYTRFQGDTSIFKTDSLNRKSIYDIIDEVFHISLVLPHKLGTSKKKEMTPKIRKIWQIAKKISNQSSGQILLKNLLKEAEATLNYKRTEITEIIFQLIMGKYLIPIQLKEIKPYV